MWGVAGRPATPDTRPPTPVPHPNVNPRERGSANHSASVGAAWSLAELGMTGAITELTVAIKGEHVTDVRREMIRARDELLRRKGT